MPYEHLVHLRRHYLDDDIFSDGNRLLPPALETADVFNQSMSKFAKLVSVYKYTPIQQNEPPIPTGQLEFIRREIYDYFGVSEEIVQNRADAEKMDAFYRGQLTPFYTQLAHGLTNAAFTDWERSSWNEILCELNGIQFDKPLHKRTEARLTDFCRTIF